MKSFFILAVVSCVFFCAACRPEEAPAVSPRKANLAKYVKKAKEANYLQVERERPLPVEELIPVSAVTNIRPVLPSLSQPFARVRSRLEKQMEQQYAVLVKQETENLLNRHRRETEQAVQELTSAQNLARRLTALAGEQRREWDLFIERQAHISRLKPDEAQLAHAGLDLAQARGELLSQVQYYYGPKAALAGSAVWDETEKAYLEAFVSLPTEEETTARLEQIVRQGDEKLVAAVSQTGDPLGETSPEVLASIRAEMLASQEKLENYIEPLYGKAAVLAARKVFNQLGNKTEAVLLESARLSYKQRELTSLNRHYQQELLDLQKQWNEAVSTEAKPAVSVSDGQ